MNTEAKREFIQNHFRYYTMNSWNRSTAPACNMKIHTHFHGKDLDKAYELIDCEDFWECFNIDVKDEINAFERKTGYSAGFNGKSGGYLVMYEMNKEGKCFPGRSVFLDIEEYTEEEVNETYNILIKFDKLSKTIVELFRSYIENAEIKTEEYTETKTRKVIDWIDK